MTWVNWLELALIYFGGYVIFRATWLCDEGDDRFAAVVWPVWFPVLIVTYLVALPFAIADRVIDEVKDYADRRQLGRGRARP